MGCGLLSVPLVGLELNIKHHGEISEIFHTAPIDGAKSGAPSHGAPSPTLTLLMKLVAGLSSDERAALAQVLAGGAPEHETRG